MTLFEDWKMIESTLKSYFNLQRNIALGSFNRTLIVLTGEKMLLDLKTVKWNKIL